MNKKFVYQVGNKKKLEQTTFGPCIVVISPSG